MQARAILLPVVVQVLLTMTIYVRLNAAKVRASRNGEVKADRRGLHDDEWPDEVIFINNNIRNQFETPVLFYVLVFSLIELNAVSLSAVIIAWLFAASRIVHAYMHIDAQHLPTRRRTFVFGCLMLVVLAAMTAWALLPS
jgi:hypothetical protein